MIFLRRKHDRVCHGDSESPQMQGISTHTNDKRQMEGDECTPSPSQRFSLCTVLFIATPILVFVLLTLVNAIYTIHYVWQLRPRSNNGKGPICNRILAKGKTSISEISGQDLQQLSSRQFYDRYVQTRQGVVIRGAYDNHSLSINREIFSDESIRRQIPNDFTVMAETTKVESRDAESSVELTMRTFVDTYKNESLYVVTEIKDLIQKEKEGLGLDFEQLLIPSLFTDFLRSASWGVTALVWWSSGGTKSVIHVDTTNNFESIFYGRKV